MEKMEKLNIAELLKDCPKGMELDCTIFDDVYFDYIDDVSDIINCYIQDSTKKIGISFSKYGCYSSISKSKCVIFPKGKNTWKEFHRPFKDGDILATIRGSIFIYKKIDVYKYCGSYTSLNIHYGFLSTYCSYLEDCSRLATEEEKQRLFQAIKDNGYKWNEETKTLEKLFEPKFHKGDWVTDGINKCQIYFIDNTNYWYSDNCILGSIESVDKRYHLWTIDDAIDGNVLFHLDSASNGIFIFKEILQLGTIQKVICYCDYDSEDGFCLGENHTCCWADSKIIHPATEKQRNLLFQKMKEAGYKWNPETKTLEKLIESKFKVGDKVQHKGATSCGSIYVIEQMKWEDNQVKYVICNLYWKNCKHVLTSKDLQPYKEETMEDKGNISDGYHTFSELYEYRLLYNASMFNELAKQGLYDVHKSKKHSDGTIPFGDENWFIVQAELPTGQISNHYEMKDWELFNVPEKEKANPYDGHTPQDVAKRLRDFLILKESIRPKFKVGDQIVRKNSISNSFIVNSVSSEYYGLALPDRTGVGMLNVSEQDDWELVTPIHKFKAGDKIKLKGGDESGIITQIVDSFFTIKCKNHTHYWPIKKQDEWELVANQFDINTLKPFDKVLVAHKKGEWHIQFFEKYSPTSKFPFICIGGSAYQRCVPYEENKHLMDTTDDCDEYFKNWE